MGECSGQLLLERQEEAGRQRKRGDPQAGDRLHGFVAAECNLGDFQEQIGRDAGDQEADADGQGPLWQRES